MPNNCLFYYKVDAGIIITEKFKLRIKNTLTELELRKCYWLLVFNVPNLIIELTVKLGMLLCNIYRD